MKNKLKYIALPVVIAALVISLCSCEYIQYLGIGGDKTDATNETQSAVGTTKRGAEPTKRPAQIITVTTAAPTQPADPLSLYIGVLKEEQKNTGAVSAKTFLYDGNADGTVELFIVKVLENRAVCDVYKADNGSVSHPVDNLEIYNGTPDGYYVGIAEKSGDRYLAAYGKTTSGREYTVRYCFIDLKNMRTATAAEDYRRKDSVTGDSIHEYSVNGESVTEDEYIIAREAYTLVYATEKTDKNGVQTIGMPVGDMITSLEERLK